MTSWNLHSIQLSDRRGNCDCILSITRLLLYTPCIAQLRLNDVPKGHTQMDLCTPVLSTGTWGMYMIATLHTNSQLITCHQWNCGKVMFLQASVIHVHPRGWVLTPWEGYVLMEGVYYPPSGHLRPGILRDMVDKRMARRILLECFLVL